MDTNKKSPLTAAPLRNPGQSLDEELARIEGDEGGQIAAVITLMLLLIVLEWARALFAFRLNPLALTIVGAPIIAWYVFKLFAMRRKLRTLRLGRDGERAVGQYLDQLQRDGYRVLHDIVGNGFNIDHVLIGPPGVFAVETKTYSKPGDKRATITVGTNGLTFSSGYTTDKPIQQTAAERRWLRELLHETTGRKLVVRSILVFPGWFVERSNHSVTGELWVLNPKALPTFLHNEPAVLDKADQRLLTYHLSRYIRMM